MLHQGSLNVSVFDSWHSFAACHGWSRRRLPLFWTLTHVLCPDRFNQKIRIRMPVTSSSRSVQSERRDAECRDWFHLVSGMRKSVRCVWKDKPSHVGFMTKSLFALCLDRMGRELIVDSPYWPFLAPHCITGSEQSGGYWIFWQQLSNLGSLCRSRSLYCILPP